MLLGIAAGIILGHAILIVFTGGILGRIVLGGIVLRGICILLGIAAAVGFRGQGNDCAVGHHTPNLNILADNTVRCTARNCHIDAGSLEHLCGKGSGFAGGIRLNLLTERVDVTKAMGWSRCGSALTDTDFQYILRRMEQYGLTSDKKVRSALSIAANENRYHPIRDWLNGLVWDGRPRMRQALHHFLGAAETDYTEEALRLFLLGAICRVFRPGCKFEVMLCLVGGQGAGKSSFFRLLAGRDEWFTDDLKRLDDENIYRKLQGHWIVEMSEMLATANAKSIEEIKSFLSRQKETYKVPYETQPADRLRQCVFPGRAAAESSRPCCTRA